MTSYFKPLRQFGAQVRKVLLANAAKHWNVPVEELTTEPNVVVHTKSGRRLSYGEIAAFAEAPAKAPEVAESELKKPEQFRLIGKPTRRLDAQAKSTGQQRFGIERSLSCEQFVKHNAEAINVSARINIHPAHFSLLRTHVGRRPDELCERREQCLVRQRLVARRLGNPKINDYRGHPSFRGGGNQNVRRLYVAMNHALLMRVLDRVADHDE